MTGYPWSADEVLDAADLNAEFAALLASGTATNAAVTALTTALAATNAAVSALQTVTATLISQTAALQSQVTALQTQPWTGVIQTTGTYTASQELFKFRVGLAVTLPVSLTGSFGDAETAATGSVSGLLKQNGSTIGSWAVGAAATVATFTFAAPVTFATNDFFSGLAPVTPDASLASLRFTFKGTRPAP